MQAHNWREHAKLNPAGGQLIIPIAVAMATDVMAPPAIAHVRGCGGKPGLEIKGFPCDKRGAGETDGVSVAAETGIP